MTHQSTKERSLTESWAFLVVVNISLMNAICNIQYSSVLIPRIDHWTIAAADLNGVFQRNRTWPLNTKRHTRYFVALAHVPPELFP